MVFALLKGTLLTKLPGQGTVLHAVHVLPKTCCFCEVNRAVDAKLAADRTMLLALQTEDLNAQGACSEAR